MALTNMSDGITQLNNVLAAARAEVAARTTWWGDDQAKISALKNLSDEAVMAHDLELKINNVLAGQMEERRWWEVFNTIWHGAKAQSSAVPDNTFGQYALTIIDNAGTAIQVAGSAVGTALTTTSYAAIIAAGIAL